MPGREHIVWVPNRGDIFTVLNFCILIAKYHIYCQRIHNENGIKLFSKPCRITIEKFDKFQFLCEQL